MNFLVARKRVNIHVLYSILLVILLFAFSPVSMANLIVNGGFESPVTDDQGPYIGDWSTFSSDGDEGFGLDIASNSSNFPRSGAQSLELLIDNAANHFAGVFQDIAGFTAGQSLTFAGYHQSMLESGGIEIRIEWRNLTQNIEIGRTNNLVPTPSGSHNRFELIATVPTGADVARVVYAIQSFSGANSQLIYADDFSLTVTNVSTPNIFALLALGFIGLGISGRRIRQI